MKSLTRCLLPNIVVRIILIVAAMRTKDRTNQYLCKVHGMDFIKQDRMGKKSDGR